MGVTTIEDAGELDKLKENTNRAELDELYFCTSKYTYAGVLVNVTPLQQSVVTRALTLFTLSRATPLPMEVSA